MGLSLHGLIAAALAAMASAEYIDYKALYPIPADFGSVYTGGSGAGGMVTSSAELDTAIAALATSGGTIVVDPSVTIANYIITAAPSGQIMIRGTSKAARAKLPMIKWISASGSPTGGIVYKWVDGGDATATSGSCFGVGDGTTKSYGTFRLFECAAYGATLDPYGNYTAGMTGVNTVSAISITSTTTIGTYERQGNDFHDLYGAGSRMDASVSCVSFNNTYDKIYEDASGWGRPASSAGVPIKLYFERLSRCVGLPSDTGNPHPDGFQIFPTSPVNQDWKNCEIIGCVVSNVGARGNFQGIFSGDMGDYFIRGAKIAGNIVVCDTAQYQPNHHITIEQAADCYVFGNKALGAKPSTNAGFVRMLIGSVSSAGLNFFAYNINSGAPVVGKSALLNNVAITSVSTANYQNEMDWPADPTNAAEAIVAARPKLGKYLRDYIDYDACKLQVSLEPGFIPLQSLYAQATSTLVTSNAAKLIGGPANQRVVASGLEYRVADDEAMTVNVTAWGSANSNVARGKYIQTRMTTAATEITTASGSLTVNGYVNNWTTSTLDTSVFNKAVFDGLLYSANAGAFSGSTTSYQKFLFYLDFKPTNKATFACNAISNAKGLTITNVISGKVEVGDTVVGTGFTGTATIASITSGMTTGLPGDSGVVQLSINQTAGAQTAKCCKAVQQIFADSTAAFKLEWSPTFGTFQMGSSAIIKFGVPVAGLDQRTQLLLSVDLTQNDLTGIDAATRTQNNFNAGVKRVLSGVISGISTPTAFDTSSGGRTFSFNGLSSGGLGIGSQSDGGGVEFQGEMNAVWMTAVSNTDDYPDSTDPAFYNKFSAQSIGANGEGPLAGYNIGGVTNSRPILYYSGTAAEWNAGMANKGSYNGANNTMSKVGAGSYT